MIHKLLDLYPKLSFLPEDDLDFSNFTSVAIPVSPGEKPQINKSRFLTALSKFTNLDLKIELDNWPDFTAKAGELIEIPLSAGTLTRIYLIGTGDQSSDDIRKAATALGRKVKSSNSKVLSALTEDKNLVTTQAVAFALSNYQFSLKSEQKINKPELTIYGDFENEIERADVLATAVWQTRNLIHTPSNIKNPEWIAKQAKKYANGVKVEVKSGAALKEFGGLRAVGGSSPKPGPRFIKMSYTPRSTNSKNKSKHIVIVGKGISYDTGGISLKRPYDIMIPMKSDMAGAAACLAVMSALKDIKANVKVTALLMCAENAISATAQRPGDVITHYGGKTVEVLNTDAEGRLVLADGLAYAVKNLKPDYLIDIATLTGSATLGLGKQYAALYSRNVKWVKDLREAGEISGDRVWHMPLIDDYEAALESDIADITQVADKVSFKAGS
ncbi:MAG: leucyl aminopeptidase family protein, partial [Actinobacteria bacterium]|nr:leucyl aminopeptidase family protein [Actinomycetota bacterium]